MKKTLPLLFAIFLVGCGPGEPTYDERPLSEWKKEMKAPTVPQRLQAVKALREIAVETAATLPVVVPMLTDALKDDDVEVRRMAAFSLSKLKSGAKAAVPALINLTADDPDKEVRSNAAQALGEIDPTNKALVQPLLKAMKDPELDVRRSAVLALANMGPAAKEAIPVLQAAFDDKNLDFDLRGFISTAIAQIKVSK